MSSATRSSSLGFHAGPLPRAAPSRPAENVSLELDLPSPSQQPRRPHSILRLCFFALVVGIGTWAYASPVSAIESITTVDVSEQEASMQQLSAFLPPAVAGLVDTEMFDSIVKVITRVFASLMIVAAGGVLPHDVFMFRILVVISQCAASSLFIATAAMDNGKILKLWFVLTYLFVACLLPALVASYEGFVLWRTR